MWGIPMTSCISREYCGRRWEHKVLNELTPEPEVTSKWFV